MATIASIRADLVGSSAVFRSEMISGQKQANQSLSSIRTEVKATSAAIADLSNYAKGFVGFEAVKAGLSSLIDAQKAAQQIHYSLLSATGSNTQADSAYKQVSATAEKLGLDLQTAALGFAQMSAAASANGISMKDQQSLFDGLARSSTVLHLSSDQTGRAITALSQIFSKGKIQAEELRQQLGDAIPGVVPRFQQAVLAMTRGTDLAGKSFDQLLQDGNLTTARFLPALSQALNETGRGAEQAAGGLNAEVNRLSTSWFKLKSELSGGLFNDAAVASLRAVSSNLSNIADVAGVAASVVAARAVAGGVRSAAGSVQTFSQANVTGPQLAAAAEAKYAAAVAETSAALAAQAVQHAGATEAAALANAVYLDAAAAAAAQARGISFEMLAVQEAAAAEVKRATAVLALNEALASNATTELARAELEARVVVAQQALATSTANLTKAQTTYNASMATSNRLQAEQGALTARSAAAQEAAAAATTTAAAASAAAAVAQAEASAVTKGSLLARGLGSLGSAALGLVGGPLGAVVLAVGAVGYAFVEAGRQSEAFRKETTDQVQSLVQLREQVIGAAKDYGTLHGAQSLSQGIDLFKDSSAQVNKTRDELANLEKQADEIRQRMQVQGSDVSGDGGLFANLVDQRSLDGINARIKELRDTLPGTAGAVDQLGAKLAGNLVGSINGVRTALDNLKAGASFADILGAISAGVDKGIADVNKARDDVTQGLAALVSRGKEWTKQADEVGKTPAQIAQAGLDKVIASIKAQKLSGDATAKAIADARTEAAPALQAAQGATNADAAKRAAEAAAAATTKWKNATDGLNNTLAQQHDELTAQLDSATKLTPAQKLLADIVGGSNEAYNHATAAIQRKQLAEATANAELSKSILLQQQANKAIERSSALNTQLADGLARQRDQAALDTTGVGTGDQEQQQLQEQLRIRQQYDQQRAQYLRDAAKPGAAPASDVDLAAISEAQQQALKIEQDGYQARLDAQADWVNGARTAYQNYADTAANKAAQSQTAFTNAFQGMEDALVNFTTTGKLNFSAFVTSIIADLARMQAKAATSALLNSVISAFGSSAGSSSANSLGGDTSYLGNSYNTGSGSSSFTLAGARANGGDVAGGSLYEVAEKGKPELLTSGGRTYLMTGQGGGTVTPASGSSGGGIGGSGGLQVVINNNAGAKVTATEGKSPSGAPQLDILIDSIEKKIAGNVAKGQGPLSGALSSRYNLNKGQNL